MENFLENKISFEKELDKWKKTRVAAEWDVMKYENMERSYLNEKEKIIREIASYHRESQDLLNQITKMNCQAKKAEILAIFENGKIDANLKLICDHKEEFSKINQNSAGSSSETETSETKPQKNFEEEFNAIEAEIYEIEAMNSTLGKRNRAVLLRVRKSLQDTEAARRQISIQITQ